MCCRGGRSRGGSRRIPVQAQVAPPKLPDPKPKTYEIVPVEGSHGDAIKCLKCGLTSYNPNDAIHKYCGNCHEYHES